ncbi:response regulator [Verrucomicrobium sp. BvORR106]|uniref:ATP-binding response regulator n=1 Tax=Verrucomicrobium sp. BvORR106 TaxID=1403819 RepID=UPI000570FABB|nr:response regulator [Verrucomicrobium sp. BvORR106]
MQVLSSGVAISGLVLVVDDQVRNRQMVTNLLTHRGFEVITATGGREALNCLAAKIPDLILLDVIMPEMDGFEVCRQIKSNRATSHVPVVFLSGSADQSSIVRGFETGGVDYIAKPFNKAELLARVLTHVQLVQTQRRHEAQLLEHNRTLGMIAEEWHQPLQHIALLTKKIAELHRPGETSLAMEANAQVESMLTSVERFLHKQSQEQAGLRDFPAITEQITSNLETLAGRWYLTAKRKCVDMRITSPSQEPLVAASPFAVRQIVDAVLSNAIHHTPRDGMILVTISRSNGDVLFQVEDQGSGFPEDYLNEPFHPYVRHAQTSTPALGLGLAAAKRTADRIGATLSISNPAQGGARATVSFKDHASH